MAIIKHPFGRYQIIDRELCRRDWVKTKELKEIIEDELSISVSEKTINNDINDMRYDPLLGYFAPIGDDKIHKAYFYTDPNYTIKAFGLRDDDINALLFYAKTINQYKEYEVFKNFSNAIEKVLDAVNIRKGISNKEEARKVVQTEITPKLTGSELIPLLVEALDNKKIIEFEYKKFDDEESKVVKLEPYLLKEDRHRWYIIGKKGKHPNPTTTYALDRIINIRILDERFQPIEFDFDDYYKYSFGITVIKEPPLEVVLSFTPFQGNYLKTLKIHHSQQTIIDNENEFRISVYVKPSWEFYEKILGYGDTVKVISPQSIIDEMKGKIQNISENYN